MSESFSENDLLDDETGDVDFIYAVTATPNLVPGESGIAFAASSTGLKGSVDGGETWQDALVNLNLSGTLPVTCVALSPDYFDVGLVVAGTPGGVFLSNSHGHDFRAVLFPDPPPTISALAFSPDFKIDQTIFAGTMEDGVFVTTNGGERWVAWNFGLLDLNVICLAISPNFTKDETLFAGTDTGIFRSTNGGRAWREVELPFGYDPVLSLVVSPQFAQDHLLYAGTENQGLWRSQDEGLTWEQLGAEIFGDPVNSLLMHGGDVLAVSSGGLWLSTDQGASWTNRLPENDSEREVTAVAACEGFGSGAKLLVAYSDGAVEPVTLD